MNNSAISLDRHIRLRSLLRQLENGVAVIGRGNQFFELPPQGLQFLVWLDEGLSQAIDLCLLAEYFAQLTSNAPCCSKAGQ